MINGGNNASFVTIFVVRFRMDVGRSDMFIIYICVDNNQASYCLFEIFAAFLVY